MLLTLVGYPPDPSTLTQNGVVGLPRTVPDVPDAIERLERRYQQLARQQSDVEFLRQLPTYFAALDADRPIRNILKRLRADSEEAVEQFDAAERKLMAEAVEIRNRLVEEASEIDNSDLPRPDELGHSEMAWRLDSLANFDQLAADTTRLEFEPLPYYETGDPTRLSTMLIILRGRLREAQYGDQAGPNETNRRPDLDDLGTEIYNVQERHSAALALFREKGRTLPGLADERLRAFAAALKPEPFLIDTDEDEHAFAERAFRRAMHQLGIIGTMQSALAGRRLDAAEQSGFDRAVAFLRGEADRLHEEIVERLSRGEGEGKTLRAVRVVGYGSLKAGAYVVGVVVTAIITLVVGAYFGGWLPGQSTDPKTPPTTTPTSP
jgi:hypothetical protein